MLCLPKTAEWVEIDKEDKMEDYLKTAFEYIQKKQEV